MDPFVAKLVLSFVVGAFWITLITIMADKYGSKIGGWIGGLPSTVVIALFFIGIAQSTEAAIEATTIIPIAQGFTGLFMLVYTYFSKRGFYNGLLLSLIGWFFASYALIMLDPGFATSAIGFVVAWLICYYFFEHKLDAKSAEKVKIKYTKTQVLGRALFSGFVISVAVLMSRLGGPIFGGIGAAFPAVYTSTLVITYYARDIEFTKSIAKSITLSGMITVITYSTAARYLFPPFGLYMGSLYAYLVTLFIGIGTYKFINSLT